MPGNGIATHDGRRIRETYMQMQAVHLQPFRCHPTVRDCIARQLHMGIDFIGTIQTKRVSETVAAQGPAIDVDYVRAFAPAHKAAGFDRMLAPHQVECDPDFGRQMSWWLLCSRPRRARTARLDAVKIPMTSGRKWPGRAVRGHARKLTANPSGCSANVSLLRPQRRPGQLPTAPTDRFRVDQPDYELHDTDVEIVSQLVFGDNLSSASHLRSAPAARAGAARRTSRASLPSCSSAIRSSPSARSRACVR
jgi:hypothetical protein